MLKATTEQPADVTDFSFTRIQFDVSEGRVVSNETLQVQNDLDFLGGIGRLFPIVADYEVSDPFASDVPLVLNTGCLTGTAFMTGLRTYVHGLFPAQTHPRRGTDALVVGHGQGQRVGRIPIGRLQHVATWLAIVVAYAAKAPEPRDVRQGHLAWAIGCQGYA